MSQTAPPTVDALPTAPSTGSPSTFAALADAFIAALATFRTQLIALATNVYNNAIDAYNNAITASAQAVAAVAAANAIAWVSGTTYAIGDARYSLVNFQTYRRLTTGAGTTDPSADATNWILVTGDIWLRKTSAYTAVAGDHIKASTTGGAWSLTSPSSPADGDAFQVLDVNGTFNTNNLTILANGTHKVMGFTTSFVLNTQYLDVVFIYDLTLDDWRF